MIKEVQAKGILGNVRQPDTWFGLKFNMNLYRGCQHQCIYCDSRSACYQIENFKNILVKTNAIDLLRKELARKRVKGTIGTGSMNDPYMPVEAERKLTARALAAIRDFYFGVHVITKSDLVLRDLETLKAISGNYYAAVSFTITTADDELGLILEPGAPSVSRRLRAMQILAENGILTGITLMPVLPFIEDDPENIVRIVEAARRHGARYIIPSFGVTLRDRQRNYFYSKLDLHFPGLRAQYERYGEQYFYEARNSARLHRLFTDLCAQYGIATRIPVLQDRQAQQLSLF